MDIRASPADYKQSELLKEDLCSFGAPCTSAADQELSETRRKSFDVDRLRFPNQDWSFFITFFDTVVTWTFLAVSIGLCYLYANYNANAQKTGDYRIDPENVAQKVSFTFLQCLYSINLFYLLLNSYVLLPRLVDAGPSCFEFSRYGDDSSDNADPEKERRVIFRFVTRGTNFDAVEKASLNLYTLLETCLRIPNYLWLIEIVTDNDLGCEREKGNRPLSVLSSDDLELASTKSNSTQTLVPPEYEAHYKGEPAKYKARALQYALDKNANPTCVARPQDWIVHFDEESTLSGAAVKEIFHFINRQDNISARTLKPPRIGQGAIHYSSGCKYEGLQHFVCTLCDSIRVTDDYGKFRLQFSLGVPLVGKPANHSESSKS